MNSSITQLQQSCVAVNKQIQSFNTKITTILTDEELKEIDETIRKEAKRIKQYAEVSTKREEELNQTRYFHTLQKGVWNITAIAGSAKAGAIVGYVMGYIQETSSLKTAGLVIFATSTLLDLAATVYATKVSLEFNEKLQIAQLDRQALHTAHVFEDFIERFREIKQLQPLKSSSKETVQDHEQTPMTFYPPSDLDKKVNACLQAYGKIPEKYRRDDVYARIISIFIQKYPIDDPLRSQLESLEPNLNAKIASDATKNLSVDYLNHQSEQSGQSSSEKEYSLDTHSESSESNWQTEQLAHSDSYSNDDLQIDSEYAKKAWVYKRLIDQRFNNKNFISFIDTKQGWRITTEQEITQSPFPLSASLTDLDSKSEFSPSTEIKKDMQKSHSLTHLKLNDSMV